MENDQPGPMTPDASSEPQVTVAITSYNHERYVEQAITSALEQQTNFPLEILVADDCSTDRTPEIIAKLAQAHPGCLTVLPRPQNLGLSQNLQDCREQAQGKYLAILEGDDYWTDPLKLQKQYDAMEAHPDWSMCYHSARVFADDGSRPDIIKPNIEPDRPLVVEDFMEQNQVQTMSVAMYRQGVIERTPDWHSRLRIGDWALHILHADAGPIGFVPGIMTAYRVHGRGLWSGLDTFRQWEEMVRLFGYLEDYFSGSRFREMREAKEALIANFSNRVKDLEKVERRYLGMRLDKVAALFRYAKSVTGRAKTDNGSVP